MVTQLNQNLAQKAITVTVADDAKKWILNQTLVDRSYGARPLRRALQKYIEDPLSEALIQGTITTRPAFIEVFLEDNKLFYRPVDAEKTEGVLLYEKYPCCLPSRSHQYSHSVCQRTRSRPARGHTLEMHSR
jgi:ATP-dependent Clp protease ATP-binding subunit ClpC